MTLNTNVPIVPVPVFAVVGQVNEGKSSVLATLLEESDQSKIRISEMPGETARCQSIELEINGKALLKFIDTPGFQQAREVLAWMQAHHKKLGDTAPLEASLAAFVEEFRNSRKFEDETLLLEPLLAGAGIVFVVDGSKPLRPHHLAEMEILRWSGRPRMAIINNKGQQQAEFTADWKKHLSSAFNLTREFNAHKARFAERIRLLQHLLEIEDTNRQAIEESIQLLEREWLQRRELAAEHILSLLETCLQLRTCKQLGTGTAAKPQQRPQLIVKLSAKYQRKIRKIEARQQRQLLKIYHHQQLEQTEALDLGDLFAKQTWQVLGLSRKQLLLAGAASGAAAGLLGDLAVGGASVGIPTLVGGLLGSGLAYWKGDALAEIGISNPLAASGKSQLGGTKICAGPPKNPNFPWILLDRILFYYQHLITRAHGRRDSFRIDFDSIVGFSKMFSSARRKKLAQWFVQIGSDKSLTATSEQEMLAEIQQILIEIEG